MSVAIIKYNAGNVQSVTHALHRLGIEPLHTDDPEVIRSADKVIFPGVGEASTAMKYLRSRNLERVIKELEQPFLGICLGLQLMCDHSAENDTPCLAIFPERVVKFPAQDKVPHMGWNNIENLKGPLFNGLDDQAHLYFVHSYYAEVSDDTVATTHYMLPFSAGLQRGNFYAIQAHPEKSGKDGARILENFLKL